MAAPARQRLNSETAPEAPGWWKERVLPILQTMLADTVGALDHGLTFRENVACCLASVRVQMPATDPDGVVAFMAGLTVAAPSLAVANSAQTLVQYNVEALDSRGAFSNGVFTVPVAGTYFFSASILMTAMAYSARRLYISANTGTIAACINDTPAAQFESLHASGVATLTAGQTVGCYAYQTSGAPRDLWADADFNKFSGHLVSSVPRTTPDCFPLPFKATINGKGFKPRGVTAWNIRDAETGKEPTLTGPVTLVWDWDGTDKVRLLDVTGLSYGHAYDLTLAVFAG